MSTNETQVPRKLPAGFTLKVITTKVGDFSYDCEVPQAESLTALLDAYRELEPDRNPEEILVERFNAANAQGATQGPKALVRAALEAHGADSPEVAEAVQKAQTSARVFITGAPRAGGGGGKRHESGLTAKQREQFGTEVAMEMMRNKGKPVSQARMKEIAESLGIDFTKLAAE